MNRRLKLGTIINIIIIVAVLIFGYQFYSKYNFNDFTKAEYQRGVTKFERDDTVKYQPENGEKAVKSYKIENTDYNDAMFYKKITVLPNTPYRVTCMIKTQDVIMKRENADAGAHISINNTTQKSDNIIGTTDWTKVTFYFNSKNETELEIGFRLGGYEENCKGTAWFSNFTLESGVEENNNEWNFLCLLLDQVDTTIQNNGTSQRIQGTLTQQDKEEMIACMRRFVPSLQELSQGKMKANYNIFEIEKVVKTMSYDSENGYYIAPSDLKEVISSYEKQGKYDHIFVVFRTGDVTIEEEVEDWIGLGGMEYRGIGFSDIRIPNQSNYTYQYNSYVNTFPEEVFIHEFLHTLERNAANYGYERPELHSYETYGYKNESLIGLKKWYSDYMNASIRTTQGTKIGLPVEIYTKKPVKESDFTYVTKLDEFHEPENIFEELNNIFYKVVELFSGHQNINQVDQNDILEEN